MASPKIEQEIGELAARYGMPQRVDVTLTGAPFRPFVADDRSGEVCMVVRRRNGKLLTAIKTFYPPNAFRLLTGGIDHGELIEAALLRETHEETGLDVAVRRFLAVIEYTLFTEEDKKTRRQGGKEDGTPSISASPLLPVSLSERRFTTFAFLLDEIGGTFGVVDEREQIGAFREIDVAELPALADTLEHVADGFHAEIDGSWADWGRFRAAVHRAVYAALTAPEHE